jgi:hypothetical protein
MCFLWFKVTFSQSCWLRILWMHKSFRPYSLHNLQIFLPGVSVCTILYFSQVQVGICLGSLDCEHHIWGSGVRAPSFLTLVLDWSKWLASRPCYFIPKERAPGSHWIGGWVGPRLGLDAAETRTKLHCQDSNPGRPVCRPSVLKMYSLFSATFIYTFSIDSTWALYWHGSFKALRGTKKRQNR